MLTGSLKISSEDFWTEGTGTTVVRGLSCNSNDFDIVKSLTSLPGLVRFTVMVHLLPSQKCSTVIKRGFGSAHDPAETTPGTRGERVDFDGAGVEGCLAASSVAELMFAT